MSLSILEINCMFHSFIALDLDGFLLREFGYLPFNLKIAHFQVFLWIMVVAPVFLSYLVSLQKNSCSFVLYYPVWLIVPLYLEWRWRGHFTHCIYHRSISWSRAQFHCKDAYHLLVSVSWMHLLNRLQIQSDLKFLDSMKHQKNTLFITSL